MAQIYDLDLERHLLAGLIRNPQVFAEVDGFITESDFQNNLHQTIFGIIRQFSHNGEEINNYLISNKIKQLSLSFKDKIESVGDYLNEICLAQINARSVKGIAENLRIVSLRRELSECGSEITQAMISNPNLKPNELISLTDEIYNEKVAGWVFDNDDPVNIFDGLEERLVDRGKNPIEEKGLMGPFKRLNEMYGSLFRPGNITTICSRSGSGKTTLLTDITFKMAQMYGIPILHFDNGEMLREELENRMVSSLSGVPLHFVETGKFAQNPKWKASVENAAKIYRSREMYYKNVAGKTVEDMISMIRRFHLRLLAKNPELKNAPVPMLFCFDYIKSTSEASGLNKAEWEVIGTMVQKFKDFISKDIHIPMITAVQSNRTGVVTGRNSANVIDDESIFSGGDRTVFYSSHAFILRKKTFDELESENGRWGTHKLINVKARHLGRDVNRALNLVKTMDGQLKPNYVNLNIKNFHVDEMGDAVDQNKDLEKFDISNINPDDVELV